MQDRYLFKAKRIDNGEWVKGNLIRSNDAEVGYEAIIIPTNDSNMYTKGGSIGDLGFENWHRVNETTICQCTGLKDKNGRVIWENDIVKDDKGNFYKAFWQEKYYQFSWVCVKSEKLPMGARWSLNCFRGYEMEIIGNIFDNPELLEE